MTIHNLRYYLNLLEQSRKAIRAGTFSALRKTVREIPIR
jgi:queuine/archaeosine tRNA-ribosyltransferase